MPRRATTVPEPALALPPELPPPERRGRARYGYRRGHQPGVRLRHRAWGGYRFGLAALHDVSAGGAGLLLDRPLASGTLLLVQLPSGGPDGIHTRLARVVHATRLSGGECLVGRRFTPPLTEGELEAVLDRFY
jgi:hypothetical protein